VAASAIVSPESRRLTWPLSEVFDRWLNEFFHAVTLLDQHSRMTGIDADG